MCWKYCRKEEQFHLFSTIFCHMLLDFHIKTGTGYSLRDERLFEISEDDDIESGLYMNCIWKYYREATIKEALSKSLISAILINSSMPSGLFYLNALGRSISKWRDVWLVLQWQSFIDIPIVNANRRLIGIYTVCKVPVYETLGINGLTFS